jgi:hypothetical protein
MTRCGSPGTHSGRMNHKPLRRLQLILCAMCLQVQEWRSTQADMALRAPVDRQQHLHEHVVAHELPLAVLHSCGLRQIDVQYVGLHKLNQWKQHAGLGRAVPPLWPLRHLQNISGSLVRADYAAAWLSVLMILATYSLLLIIPPHTQQACACA